MVGVRPSLALGSSLFIEVPDQEVHHGLRVEAELRIAVGDGTRCFEYVMWTAVSTYRDGWALETIRSIEWQDLLPLFDPWVIEDAKVRIEDRAHTIVLRGMTEADATVGENDELVTNCTTVDSTEGLVDEV